MALRVGDNLFNSQGQPGYLAEKNENFRSYKIETDKTTVQKEFRHGFINGLSNEERKIFNEFMDKVKETSDPTQRVATMHEKLQEMERDPASNKHMAAYIKAELAHVINQSGIKPRTYNIDVLKVR